MGQLNRREFVVMAGAASQVLLTSNRAFAAGISGDELTALTLSEASRRIHSGEVTSAQLTQALLDRIAIYNPKINAFITVMRQEALAQAAKLDGALNREEVVTPQEPETISKLHTLQHFWAAGDFDSLRLLGQRTADRLDDCRAAILRR